MQINHTNFAKNIKKIKAALNNIEKMPKVLIKYGLYTFLLLFSVGNIWILLNNTILPYNSYYDMVAKEIVKKSFIIAAEAIIGGLAMDFVFKKTNA